MSLAELLPTIQSLPRSEKFQLVEMLVRELAVTDPLALLEPKQTYPVWSPHNAYKGAATLMQLLETLEAKT